MTSNRHETLQDTATHVANNSRRYSRSPVLAYVGMAVGILMTPPALIAALISSGAGHGDYVLARAIYPIPLLLTLIIDNDLALITLALVQYPVAGLLIGGAFCHSNGMGVVMLFALIVIHAWALAFAFGDFIPGL